MNQDRRAEHRRRRAGRIKRESRRGSPRLRAAALAYGAKAGFGSFSSRNASAALLDTVSARSHQQFDEFLRGPIALRAEPVCQPIEQFRMRGCLAEHAEIVRCGHDAASEQMQPDAIDHHPREQRIRRIGDGARQIDPSAAVPEGSLGRTTQRFQESSPHNVARSLVVPPDENGLVHPVPSVTSGPSGSAIVLQR